jgi:hypothetical protein
MGIEERLPPFFDFPVGTMFWARTQALKPLLALALDWNDYPEEQFQSMVLCCMQGSGYCHSVRVTPGIGSQPHTFRV